jgi:hypothetical protein
MMSKVPTTRLQDVSLEQAAEALICLKDLVSQIRPGRLTDELGHDFKLNDAFMRAVALLERMEHASGEAALVNKGTRPGRSPCLQNRLSGSWGGRRAG